MQLPEGFDDSFESYCDNLLRDCLAIAQVDQRHSNRGSIPPQRPAHSALDTEADSARNLLCSFKVYQIHAISLG